MRHFSMIGFLGMLRLFGVVCNSGSVGIECDIRTDGMFSLLASSGRTRGETTRGCGLAVTVAFLFLQYFYFNHFQSLLSSFLRNLPSDSG